MLHSFRYFLYISAMGNVGLKSILNEGEGYLTEFKESINHIDKEICAFANASGGTLYIGITDSGKVKKTPLTNTLKSQIQSVVRSLDPPPHIQMSPIGGVIKINVSESEHKPVKAPGGFYLRIGSNSQKLTRDEIFSFAIKENKIKFDRQLYIDESATDLLNIRQVEFFRQRAKLDMELDNLQLLENLGCLIRQRQQLYLTFAGVLLFGNSPQKIFPSATITVLHMQDMAKILEQKIIKGTLFEQLEKAFQFIKDNLRKTTIIESLVRQEELEIPEYVIRELLVNTLVHRDYFETASDIVIKIFPDHIEFTNPGILNDKLSIEKIYGKSYRRNALIADIFFHAGYIERAGTGLLRVREALKTKGLPPLQLLQEGMFFIASIPRRTLMTNMTLKSMLNKRQSQLFSLPDQFFPFSSMTYADHFHITDRMARLDLQTLIADGKLTKMRISRQIRYKKGAH